MIAMPRFQFTLRDLFLMTTLIAFGVGGLAWAFRPFHVTRDTTLIALAPLDDAQGYIRLDVAFLSSVLIGAGLGTPFHRKSAGGRIGLLAFFAVAVLFIHG